MRIKELITRKRQIRYRIYSLNLRIEELKRTYIPNRGEGPSGGKRNSSPQETVLIQIDTLQREINELIAKEIEVDGLIEKRLEVIDNTMYRMVVLDRLNGKVWKGNNAGYSERQARRIFKESMAILEGDDDIRD